MTKVLFIGAILALGFGPTVFAVLHVLGEIARQVIGKFADDAKSADFLIAILLAAAFGALFATELGVKRYFIAALAYGAAHAVKRYKDK